MLVTLATAAAVYLTSSLRAVNKDGLLGPELSRRMSEDRRCRRTRSVSSRGLTGSLTSRTDRTMKSDVEDLMPRLLPIEFGAGSADLDLSGPPRNPQEYLRQVQSVLPPLTQ